MKKDGGEKMGKKQFLRELNRKLRTLEKSERRRYLDD